MGGSTGGGRPPSDGHHTASLGRWPANVCLSHTEDCVQVGTRRVKSGGQDTGERGTGGIWSDVSNKPCGPQYGDADGRETVPAWDCSPECPVRLLDEQTGELPSGGQSLGARDYINGPSSYAAGGLATVSYAGQSGGASRFFYTAKASRAERNAGLDGFEERMPHDNAGHVHADGRAWDVPGSHSTKRANHHPTVKPVALMRWLVRLVTPPGGLVLDPFAGSGTTGVACALEGFRFHGIERDEEYAAITTARIAFWEEHGEDGLRIVAERDRAEAARQAIAAAGQLDLFGAAG